MHFYYAIINEKMQSSIIIYSLNTIMLRANFFYTGEFGIVYRALYSPNSDFTSIPQPVAVKTLKGLLFTITLYTNTASCSCINFMLKSVHIHNSVHIHKSVHFKIWT